MGKLSRKTRIIGLALFIGLALGVGGAIAKEKLNAGFTTPYQVEEMLELPILASVPSMGKGDLTVGGKSSNSRCIRSPCHYRVSAKRCARYEAASG